MLTACHVVADADRIEVRLRAGMPGATAVTGAVMIADSYRDLALLTIEAIDVDIPPQPIGAVTALTDAVTVSLAGFPRWKLRRSEEQLAFRVAAVEEGVMAILANFREGTYQITVEPPAPDPDPAVSPWQGISGGPVFVGEALVCRAGNSPTKSGE